MRSASICRNVTVTIWILSFGLNLTMVPIVFCWTMTHLLQNVPKIKIKCLTPYFIFTLSASYSFLYKSIFSYCTFQVTDVFLYVLTVVYVLDKDFDV